MSRRILIIDDEDDIRQVAALSLETIAGWDVVLAKSGTEGVAVATREQPDAILLDVMMPEMDGPTTFLKLQATAQTTHIPVRRLPQCLSSGRPPARRRRAYLSGATRPPRRRAAHRAAFRFVPAADAVAMRICPIQPVKQQAGKRPHSRGAMHPGSAEFFALPTSRGRRENRVPIAPMGPVQQKAREAGPQAQPE